MGGRAVTCYCTKGHTVYESTGRKVECDECGAQFDIIPYEVGPGHIPMHDMHTKEVVR